MVIYHGFSCVVIPATLYSKCHQNQFGVFGVTGEGEIWHFHCFDYWLLQQLLCLEFANTILIFAVLMWVTCTRKRNSSQFCFYIFCGFIM